MFCKTENEERNFVKFLLDDMHINFFDNGEFCCVSTAIAYVIGLQKQLSKFYSFQLLNNFEQSKVGFLNKSSVLLRSR